MNVAAVADETDIVCSFIFKNRWAVNNLDKICGQHSSQVSRIGVRIAKKVEAEGQPQFGKLARYMGPFRKLEKASPFIVPPVDRVKSCFRLRYPC